MTNDPNPEPTVPSLNLSAGQKLAGCYVLQHQLSACTGQLIWIAQDEVLGKEVSLHFLPASVARDTEAVQAIRLEVKRNRSLIHPGILRVYDLVEGGDWVAVAMDSFEGLSVATLLHEEGRFETEDLDDWLKQLCDTLGEAHRIKLIHRDLAPENIFISPTGQLLLANFGIGRVVQDSLARSGDKGVTPRLHTLSPQMLDGAPAAPTDDVYGVGALFFHLLTGKPVFGGPNVPEQIRSTVPPHVSEVRDDADEPGKPIPPGWDNIIAACLNKRSDERPSKPAEIVTSIEAYAPAPVAVPAVVVPAALAAAIAEEHPEPAQGLRLVTPPPEPPLAAEEPPPIIDEAPVEPEAVAPEPLDEPEHSAQELPVEDAEESHSETPASEMQEEHEPAAKLEAVSSEIAARPEPGVKQEVKPYDYSGRPAYATDEDALSKFFPHHLRLPAAVAAILLVGFFLLRGAFKNAADQAAPTPSIAASDSADRSELTSVKNSVREPAADKSDSTSSDTAPTAVPPAPKATPGETVKSVVLLAAAAPAPTPAPLSIPAVSSPLDNKPGVSLDKQIADKAAALDRMKQQLAADEQVQQARAKEQDAAAAALADAQKTADEKTKAAIATKKQVEELVAVRKKRQDDQQAAEMAAQAAQQLAAEKVKAAEDAKKALADFETQNRDKLTSQDKVDAEIQALQQTIVERQKAAADKASAAAAAATARQQHADAIKLAEQDLVQAKADAAKASADEDRKRQAVDGERHKLDDEIASMKALFEQKMKDIETRRQALETGGATTKSNALVAPAATPAPAPPRPEKPAATPVAEAKPATPVPVMPAPVIAPAATPAPATPAAVLAMKTTPVPMPPAPATPAPARSTGGAFVDSLGIRFAPVGDVLFAVWQTRVQDFDAFAKAVNLKSTAWRGPGFRQGPDHPVVNVTWTDAIAFCKWLTDKERKEGLLTANQFYRLPYDLEWSKAVGLPDETGKTPEQRDMGVPDVYPWGTQWPPPKGAGNYTGEETGSDVAIKGYDDGFAWTAPVGSFPPNKFGLYDMGGNVWQWCMDSWNNESKAKVLRGASWYNGALKLSLLSSCRVHAAPDSSTDNYGFRIVLASETAKAAKK